MKKITVNLFPTRKRTPINPEEANSLILAAGLFLLFWAAVWTFSWSAVSNFLTICALPVVGIVFGSRQLITGFHTTDKKERRTALLFGSVLLATTVLLLAAILLAAMYA